MDQTPPLSNEDRSLLQLLQQLEARGFDFVAPTPATHQRVLERRRGARAGDLRDILGWSMPFEPGQGPAFLLEALDAGGMLARTAEGLKAEVRVARVRGRLFLHSAFPTEAEDAVFLGPDSYRFADFIARELPPTTHGQVVDVGGGAGVGAIIAAGLAPEAKLALTDLNPAALRLARINAAHAGARVSLVQTSGLDGVASGLDIVLANPPYMAASSQTYRDGGRLHGGEISVDWAEAALDRLAPGGRLLLYTGSAITAGGRDELREALEQLAGRRGATLTYAELDPDVFGEELEKPSYADVERIAVVTATLTAA